MSFLDKILPRLPVRPPPDSGESEHPWLHGRRDFENFFGGLARRLRTWKILALLSMFMAVILAAGIVAVSTQRKIVPYVVMVDKLGPVRHLGVVENAAVPELLHEITVRQFVYGLRTVPGDSEILEHQLRDLYARSSREALQAAQTMFATSKEEIIAMVTRRETRHVEKITKLIRVPNSVLLYHAQWTEKISRGGRIRQAGYEGYFQIERRVDDAEGDIIANPFGIYVSHYQIIPLASTSTEP